MQDSISFLIAQLCKAHRNAANNLLNEVGLHVGQEMVLLQLWKEDGATQSDLAGQMCVEAPTVTRMLQRMEREGLVERRADAEDARVSRVFLTEQSVALQRKIEQTWATLEARTTESLTAEERMLLRRLLLQMHSNLTE